MNKYTKKQITEAITYWEKQLADCNYTDMLDESKVGDFFCKLFTTKKFLDKQVAIEKAASNKTNAEFLKEHPLAAVAKKISFPGLSFFFMNADVENDGYPIETSSKADCIAVRHSNMIESCYDDIADDKNKVLDLVKSCGYDDKCEFYVIDRHYAVIIPELGRNWYIKKLNESDDVFEKIDDIVKYLKDKKIKWINVVKFQRLNAVQSKGGEEVETVGSDGNVETKRKTNKGDWIVNNVSNKDNKWIIDDKTFKKKYEEEKDGVYKPKGGPMLAAKISDCTDKCVEFAPPNWGGDVIKVKNDGWFMKDPSNEKNIYAISKNDFDATYKKQG